MSEYPNGGRFHCPRCRSTRLHPIIQAGDQTAETEIIRNLDGKAIKTVTTTSQSTKRYWLCQDCAMTFPFPQDLKEKAVDTEKLARRYQLVAAILLLIEPICLLLYLIVTFFDEFDVITADEFISAFLVSIGVPGVLLFPIGFLCYLVSLFLSHNAKKRRKEYENLLIQCLGP